MTRALVAWVRDSGRTSSFAVFGPAILAATIAGVAIGFVADEGAVLRSVSAVFHQAPLSGERGGDSAIFDDAVGLCCEGFIDGARLALLTVLCGGLPTAVAAACLAIMARRFNRQLPSRYRPLAQAGLALQLANFGLTSLVTGLAVWQWDASVWIDEPITLFIALNAIASGSAILAWRAVSATVRPTRVLSLRVADA